MKRLIVRIGLGIVMGGLLSGGLQTNSAMAALVTFNFTGKVDSVGSQVSGGPFSVDQVVKGSYTFSDTGTNPAISPNGTIATYSGRLDGPSTNLNVTFGPGVPAYTASFATGTTNTIIVTDAVAPNHDAYEVNGFFSGASVNSQAPTSFKLDLEKLPTNTFTSTSLPITPPSISSLSDMDKTFRLVFGNGNGNSRTVIVNLSTLTAVPLPAAVILFGAGLIALVGFGAGGWRKRNNSLA